MSAPHINSSGIRTLSLDLALSKIMLNSRHLIHLAASITRVLGLYRPAALCIDGVQMMLLFIARVSVQDCFVLSASPAAHAKTEPFRTAAARGVESCVAD